MYLPQKQVPLSQYIHLCWNHICKFRTHKMNSMAPLVTTRDMNSLDLCKIQNMLLNFS